MYFSTASVCLIPQAVERFGDVSDRLKASGQTFEQSKQNAAGAVLKFNEAKQRRYVTFNFPQGCTRFIAGGISQGTTGGNDLQQQIVQGWVHCIRENKLACAKYVSGSRVHVFALARYRYAFDFCSLLAVP